MSKYISLGTMSGTSMDGIDLSIINSDGETNTSVIDNFFFEYSSDFKKELINIRKEVLQKDDLTLKKGLINDLSRKITLLHVEAIQEFLKKNSTIKLDLIGYHGHTLIHKPEQGFTFQLGNPELMAQLLKTFLIPKVFFLISALVKIFLLSSLPEGSPTIVVPPPNNTIGV